MKIKHLMLIAAAALFSGCAGYNTTMFMTKSNAGLDIDMKPPTAEINISRKEAVIEPVFEKGQTPPVMASFKPNVHFGGALGNYFLGVDQTFAGGDAAQTMAVLYDAPTFLAGDPAVFNSEIKLETPITSTNIFVTPATPGKIRPFIFGTDTSLGLKVAWSGAGGQFPDTVKAGFNRKEFAWAPITMSKDGKSVKMPSFLATIESNIGGESDTNKPTGTNAPGQNGGIQSIQYFATGEAASRLARQKDVRVAMLKRLDPRYGSGGPQIGTGAVARQMLDAMENAFNQLGNGTPPDEIAGKFYQRLQDLKGVKVPVSFEAASPPILYYSKTLNTNLFNKNTTHSVRETSSTVTLSDVTAYMDALEHSTSVIKSIEAQLKSSTNILQLSVNNATNLQPILQPEVIEMEKQLVILDGEQTRVRQEVVADKDVSSAFDYFKMLTKP